MKPFNFKYWLEAGEEDYTRWKDIILDTFDLDHNVGMSQTLDAFKPDVLIKKLQSKLGLFAEISLDGQRRIIDYINQSRGTISDLIRKIVDESQGKKNDTNFGV